MKNWKNINANPKHREYKRQLSFLRNRRIQLMKRTTPAEREVKRMLKYLRIYYKPQKAFFHKGTLYVVDFFLPNKKIVIEVDGIQHSIDQRQVEYDKRRTEFLESKRGVKVIRFTNSEVLETPDVVFDKLESIAK
jgi:very-short-patch-repair endonuclease